MTIATAIAIARTWTDTHYKAKLINDPHAALAEAGVELPAGTTVKVVQNTANTQYLVLPVAPAMSLSLLKFVGQASLVDDAMLPS